MTAILQAWQETKIQLSHLMRIYLKNNASKFHPDPIWNDGGLIIFEDVAANKKNKKTNKKNSEMSK